MQLLETTLHEHVKLQDKFSLNYVQTDLYIEIIVLKVIVHDAVGEPPLPPQY